MFYFVEMSVTRRGICYQLSGLGKSGVSMWGDLDWEAQLESGYLLDLLASRASSNMVKSTIRYQRF